MNRFYRKILTGIVLLCATTVNAAGQTSKDHAVEEIEGSRIFGTDELPGIFYVIAWKERDIKSYLSLLEDYLEVDTTLLDRDVMRRKMRFYQAVKTKKP